jgi:hypothetical protein
VLSDRQLVDHHDREKQTNLRVAAEGMPAAIFHCPYRFGLLTLCHEVVLKVDRPNAEINQIEVSHKFLSPATVYFIFGECLRDHSLSQKYDGPGEI